MEPVGVTAQSDATADRLVTPPRAENTRAGGRTAARGPVRPVPSPGQSRAAGPDSDQPGAAVTRQDRPRSPNSGANGGRSGDSDHPATGEPAPGTQQQHHRHAGDPIAGVPASAPGRVTDLDPLPASRVRGGDTQSQSQSNRDAKGTTRSGTGREPTAAEPQAEPAASTRESHKGRPAAIRVPGRDRSVTRPASYKDAGAGVNPGTAPPTTRRIRASHSPSVPLQPESRAS